jgi:hypothetical protein
LRFSVSVADLKRVGAGYRANLGAHVVSWEPLIVVNAHLGELCVFILSGETDFKGK